MTPLVLSRDLPAARAPSLLWSLTAVAAALTLLALVWAPFDPRLIDGTPVWAKPLKFALSFVALFATLALVEDRLSPRWRDGLILRGMTAVMGTAMVLEMGYMIYQAARAEASHFNFSTPFHEIMYVSVMGTGAVLLVLGIAVFGVAAARDRDAALTPGLRSGVTWGFVLSFVLTLIVAGTMSSGTGHHVGTPVLDTRLPLVGWSAEVGDLRPAHFLSLHAMQALPVLGLLLDRAGTARPGRTVALAGAGYAALTLAVFAQALMGLPLIRL